MPREVLPQQIQEALLRGATVLTPNQRSARALQLLFDSAQTTQTWTPPEILTFDSWLQHLWTRMILTGDATRTLLNRTQEQAIWRALIAADPESTGLRSLDSLAQMSAEAWRTLHLHNGRHLLPALGVSTDTRAFSRWAQTFDRTLERSRWLTQAQLPAAIEAAVAEATAPIPNDGLLLTGFDHLPPAHSTLLATLTHAGYPIHRHQTHTPSTPTLHSSPDPQSELQFAADYIRQALAQDPQARIAVVVPDLADRRAHLTRIFAETLAPDLNRITATQDLPFEFSLGHPLSQTPIADTALNLLHLAQNALPLATISTLLLSPYFGSSSAPLAVAEFDAYELRETRLLRPELTLPALIRLAEQSPRAANLQPLIHRLRAMQQVATELHLNTPDLQSHADWADAFRKLLHAAGWQQAASTDSLAFQTQTRFDAALDELATLDFNGLRTSAAEALRALTRITAGTIFAPESRRAPIQILGPLELATETFDHLWFLSAGDLTWPTPPAANPLIPWQIQQTLAVPGSDRTRDHAQACALTARIAQAAPHVVFSFSHTLTADDSHQRPSPALSGLALSPHPSTPIPATPTTLPLESIPDNIHLPGLPARSISGGAQILQNQAACAFRAFAEHRLFASALNSRTLGLDPGERGSLVHKVMEHLWTRVQGQIELRELTEPERHQLLDQCIVQALEKATSRAHSPWEIAYLDLQAERLRNLLRPWLTLELTRPDFAVQQSEKTLQDAQLGPLTLTLRVDRIDQTDLGPVILDYKTGDAAPSEWLTDRPDQPQLPLYAILSDTPIAGVAFALLRPGSDLALKGFATSDDVFGRTGKLPFPTLADQVQDWRRVLHTLAEDFAAGESTPNPKSYPKTCTYCDQRILCRLNLNTLAEICDEDEEDPQRGPGAHRAEAELNG